MDSDNVLEIGAEVFIYWKRQEIDEVLREIHG